MTSKELAKKLGISEATVSLALNDRPGISAATKQKILEAAKETGLEINKKTRGTGRHKKMIYIMQYEKGRNIYTNNFFRETIAGIESQCMQNGYLANSVSVFSREQFAQRLKSLESEHPAGVILFAYMMTEADFQLLSFTSLNVILMDNQFRSSRFTTIQINNYDAFFESTNYIIKKTGEQPGYLKSTMNTYDFEQRSQGFYAALKHNVMPKSGSIIHELPPTIDGAYKEMLDIIKSGEQLSSSYVADNDMIAIGAIKAMKECGINVPKDISVIGFDDLPMSEYIDPPLTTVKVPRFYMGTLAVDILLSSFNRPEQYALKLEVTPTLEIRKSIRTII
ncbi:MAG: LacI family transcriptional regulator [Butyrivibrio sp.]|nr:LacI family transcriptional regulator [Butyrivibrio sp.]